MGGCAGITDTGKNDAPDMTKYANLKVGETFTHPNYCEYCTESSVNCGNNGEFTRAGNGSGKCKCRGLCNDGCCRKACKRTSYSGTIEECCQRGGPSYYKDSKNVVRTCDPQYRADKWTEKTCDQPMKDFCKQNDNLFGTACRQWVTTFQPIGQYDRATANGTVDDVILDVCNRPENAEKDECGCVVAANLVRKKLPSANDLPVQCMMNMCANNPRAFRTSTQLAPCNITNCEMNITDMEIVANDTDTFSPNFSQACGQAAQEKKKEEEENKTTAMLKKYGPYGAIGLIVLVVLIYLLLPE